MSRFFSRKRTIILCVVLSIVIFLLIACDSRLIVREYEVETDKVDAPVRIAFISDLHSCYYGKDQQNLINKLLAEEPDVLFLGGDIFDSKLDDKNTELFLSGISGKLPIYFVTGNHDLWGNDAAVENKMKILDRYGVTVLSGESEIIEINGAALNLCGVDDLSAFESESNGNSKEESFFSQIDAVNAKAQNEAFTVLLSHRPDYFEKYATYDFDLVLSGHAHGGQWRIPLLLNGLYAPNQGLFPDYAGGTYDKNGTTMIVGRGLARESTLVPRIFNRPEIVIINVK